MRDRVEKIAACAASLLRSSSNRDKPAPSTAAPPAIVKLVALICSTAAAIAASRAVQSYALRLYSRTALAVVRCRVVRLWWGLLEG